MRRRMGLLVCFAFFLLGCRNVPPLSREKGVPNLDAATYRRLEELLDLGAAGEVLQDLTTLNREYPERWNGGYRDLERQARDILLKSYLTAEDGGDPQEALNAFRALEVLGLTGDYPPDKKFQLMLRWAKALADGGSMIPALLTFQKALDLGAPSEEILKVWGDRALGEGHRALVDDITRRLSQEGFEVPRRFTDFLDRKVPPLELMKGTVTVWVNRGIKVEQGIGYADRVIGSGFFIDKRGYLITNYHVVSSEVDPEYKGYSRLFIRLPGRMNDKIPAEVVGWDPVFDIALLKTSYDPEYVFSFKDDGSYEPGDEIFAIGSPGGLENTLTSGIISASKRRLLEMGDSLQVDVPINSGNSGGPLLNSRGELVGVVFAGIEIFEGINFAIPSHWISPRIPFLYAGGRMELPWLGLALHEGNKGLEVIYVFPDSPAFRGGMVRGDILVDLDGGRVTTLREAQSRLLAAKGQRLIRARWKRGGSNVQGIFYLAVRPENPLEEALENDIMEEWFVPFFGMTLERVGGKKFVVRKVYTGLTGDETGFSKDDPVSINRWDYDEENEALFLQMKVRKRKAGFLENFVQMGAYSRVSNLL